MPGSLIIANADGREIGSSYSGGNGTIGVPVYAYQGGSEQAPTAPVDPGVPTPRQIDDMLRLDGKAAQIEQALTLPIRSADWQIVPGQGANAEQAANWVRSWISELDPALDDVVGTIAGGSLFGRALFEIVWGTDPQGRIVPERVAWRPPHNTTVWRDEQTGRIRGLRQRLPGATEPVEIPLERTLVYLHNRHRAPFDGVSDVLPAYAAYRSKRAIRWLWHIYLNRAAMPWTVAKAGLPDPAAIRSIAQRLATIRSGGVIGLGPDESASALDAGGQAAAAFDQALVWCDRQMTGSVLASFLDLGQAKVGSFALSKDHSDFFTMGRDAVLKSIAADLTSQLVARAVRASWPEGTALPTFRFDALSEADTSQPVQVLQAIATASTLNPAVPAVFVTELVTRVAGLLGLDVSKITAQMDARPGPDGQMAAAAQAATALLAATSPEPAQLPVAA